MTGTQGYAPPPEQQAETENPAPQPEPTPKPKAAPVPGEKTATPASDTFRNPPATEGHMFVPSAEFKSMQDQLARLRDIEARQAKDAEAARVKELQRQAKDDPIAALDAQRANFEAQQAALQDRITAMENERLSERLDAEIDTVLSGFDFAGDTPEERAFHRQILKDHLRPQFEAIKTPAGTITVRERVSYRPADAVLRERLSGKALALFLAPTSRGGSGTDGTRTPATQQQAELNDVQKSVIAFNKQRTAYPAIGFGPAPKASQG